MNVKIFTVHYIGGEKILDEMDKYFCVVSCSFRMRESLDEFGRRRNRKREQRVAEGAWLHMVDAIISRKFPCSFL